MSFPVWKCLKIAILWNDDGEVDHRLIRITMNVASVILIFVY